MAIPATGFEIGTPALKRERELPQTVAMEELPLDSRYFRYNPQGIGKLIIGWKHCFDSALSKMSMTDLSSSGT